MASIAKSALTANEAAIVTRVPVRQIHRIIDAGVLPLAKGSRTIRHSALVGLRLAYLTAGTLTLDARRRVIAKAVRGDGPQTIAEEAIIIPMQPIIAEVEQGLDVLEKARALVKVDKEIMGGTPCIAGTRIPVHLIAEMVANGESNSAIVAAYPSLSGEQVERASIYAQAYPLRGRPPIKKPGWLGNVPKMTRTLSLEDLIKDAPTT
jgi:uncharacterized protein (DUF433 family)